MKKYLSYFLIIFITLVLNACTNYEEVYNKGSEFLIGGNYSELSESLVTLSKGEDYLYDNLVFKVDEYVIEKFNELISSNQIIESRSFLNNIRNTLSHFETSRYDVLEARLLFAENNFYDSLRLLETVEVASEDIENYHDLQREVVTFLVAEIFQYYWDARTISDYIFIEEQLKYVFSFLSDREKYLLTYSLMDLQWHHLNFGLNDIFLERFVKSEIPGNYQEFSDRNANIESLNRAPSAIELASYLEPKAVIVNVFNASGRKTGNGSGFFINDNGLIVTNEHVIRDASRVSIQMNNGTLYDVTVLLTDERRDFALLKAPIENNDYVTLGNSYYVRTGETIYTYGSPLGISNTMTTGLVSKNLSIVNRQEYIQVSAPISPGSSGGMLVNEFGQVIGITTNILINGQNMNLSIPINRVINSINEIDPIIQLNPKDNGHFQTMTTQTIRQIHQLSFEEPDDSEKKELFGFLNFEGEYVYAIIEYENGDQFKGELRNGEFFGNATIRTSEYRFHGQLINGEKNGFGITDYFDGSFYVGHYLEDEFHGQGSFYWGSIEDELFGHAYVGSFQNGLREGKGIYLWPNGDIYEGDFVEDIKSGFGTYIWSDGDMYEGEFLDDEIFGEGIIFSVNGDILAGNFVDGVINGPGTLLFASGNLYVGNFVDGEVSGKGTLFYGNGDIFEGSFEDGNKNGQGTLYFINGDILKGDFVDGYINGQGILNFANGNTYLGNFVNGERTGQGTLNYSNGDVYTGSFVNGSRTGKGTFRFANGDVYKGDFLNGDFSGYGEYFFRSGAVYRGNFLNGSPWGTGTLTLIGGDRFVASWNGWLNGIGTYYYISGRTTSARLINGVWD